MTQGRTQETDTEMTHETTGRYIGFRVTDKTIVMIHSTNTAEDMTLVSKIRDNKVEQFDWRHLAVTIEEATIKPQTSRAAVMTTDHVHHTKTDNMTLFPTLDDEATMVQTGYKTKLARIAIKSITPPDDIKLVLIA